MDFKSSSSSKANLRRSSLVARAFGAPLERQRARVTCIPSRLIARLPPTTDKCNVGYAFINISEPSKVPIFYDALQGRQWDPVNTDKCCDINYGRIQGIDELLRHFAHSALLYDSAAEVEALECTAAEHAQV